MDKIGYTKDLAALPSDVEIRYIFEQGGRYIVHFTDGTRNISLPRLLKERPDLYEKYMTRRLTA